LDPCPINPLFPVSQPQARKPLPVDLCGSVHPLPSTNVQSASLPAADVQPCAQSLRLISACLSGAHGSRLVVRKLGSQFFRATPVASIAFSTVSSSFTRLTLVNDPMGELFSIPPRSTGPKFFHYLDSVPPKDFSTAGSFLPPFYLPVSYHPPFLLRSYDPSTLLSCDFPLHPTCRRSFPFFPSAEGSFSVLLLA